MTENRADNVTPIRADARWLTYEEAGQLLGVDPDSISRRARRAGWSRQPGNDGRTRVAVPLDVLPASPADVRPKSAPDVEADSPAESRADKGGQASGDESRTIKALEDKLVTVREALARERERADAAQATADRRAEDLIEARDRLESTLGIFRAAEAEQRERLGRAEGAEAVLRESLTRAEARRRRAGLVRLRAAGFDRAHPARQALTLDQRAKGLGTADSP
jgi:hypothetical protein